MKIITYSRLSINLNSYYFEEINNITSRILMVLIYALVNPVIPIMLGGIKLVDEGIFNCYNIGRLNRVLLANNLGL